MDTKKQIIEATRQVMSKLGLAKTTTKEIAKAAGCSEGTLYNYFAHKEDLFLAVMEEDVATLDNLFDEQGLANQTVEANLAQVVRAALQFCEQIVPINAALFADPVLLAAYRKKLQERNFGPQNGYRFFAPYIKAEQKLGRIADTVDPTTMSGLLYGACFHYVFTKHFMGEDYIPFSEQQFIENLVRTTLTGLYSHSN